MATYGPLSASVLGMKTNSSAFGTISQNITNLNTGGYKSSDARFSTVLASTFDNNSDVGGVKNVIKNSIAAQGRTIATINALDLAINGQGMFILNSSVDGTGDTFYTRDGAFQTVLSGTSSREVEGQTVVGDQAYLADKNGNFLQGMTPDNDGNFSLTSTIGPIRIDQDAFASANTASTTASIALNLPTGTGTAQTATGSIFTAGLTDANGDLISGSNVEALDFTWTKVSGPGNSWTLAVSSTAATPPLNAAGTSTLTQQFDFDTSGGLPNNTTYTFSMPWADGQATSNITLDVSDVTSIGNDYLYFDFQKNGRNEGELADFGFDSLGHVQGRFTNGEVRNLYKLPLAKFVNPDGLNLIQGNRFSTSVESGTASLRFADIEGIATFSPFAHEISNTNLQNEFTKMIMVQQAYNMSATVFSTVDQMTKVASDLKA